MFSLNHVALRGIILVAFSNAGLGFPLKAALEPARWCIPVSGAAGGGPGQAEESIRAQGKERSGKILSAFGSIVINVYGKREGRRPDGMDSTVRWGSGSNEPLHSREELKEHIGRLGVSRD